MTRVEKDKYSVLIRSDYLYALSKLASNRQDRDMLIQDAVRAFLKQYPFPRREEEIRKEQPRVRMMHSVEFRPTYHLYLEFVRIPDLLVQRMDLENRHPASQTKGYGSLGTVLNAAIRLFLKKKDPTLLEDDAASGTTDEI